MRRPLLQGLVPALLLALPAEGQPPRESSPAPVIQVAVAGPAKPAGPRFDLSLLPDPLELVAGNAAQYWLHANQAAARGPQLTEKEGHWPSSDVPLKDLPQDDVQKFLERHKAALQLADKAARYDRCAWDLPPVTMQNANDFYLLDAQPFRQTAVLIALRCRLELSRRQFDKALRTLQTGFALVRHLGEAPTLIHQLVGVVISSLLLARVEEFLQTPGAPNLYWALTALPSPLIDVRKSARHELDTLYRTFPQLRDLEKGKLKPEEVDKQLEELCEGICQLEGRSNPVWKNKLAFAALAVKVYPQARQYLLDRGKTAEEVEEWPRTQVVIAYYLSQYDRVRDEAEKLMALPHWQAREGLNRLDKQIQDAVRANDGNVLITLLFPVVLRVYEAQARMDRQLASLRCVEALRLHADAQGGKLPATLAEVRAVPLPTDPLTGKGFDTLYKVDGAKAVLDIPAMPGQPPTTARRYELTGAR
jgi:hypothetical protein